MGESAIVKCATCGRKTEFFAELSNLFVPIAARCFDLAKWLDDE